MSSDDSGFDKEAEREKLREKYERDKRDRENTQRMSELLLQGATMTGKHCDNCGDPIFRYDGQEFCPTCQHEAAASQQAEANEQAGADEQTAASEQAGADEQTRANGQAAAADDSSAATDADRSETDRRTEAGGRNEAAERSDRSAADRDRSPDRQGDEPRVEINGVRVADRHADASNLRRPPSQTGDRGSADRHPSEASRRHGEDRAGTARRRTRDADEFARSHADGDASVAGGLGPAREALVRKLTDLARRAEETDDVARARELLAATREAAEALEALERANR